MNATEKGRRSDALYYDNGNVTRRNLCDMIANMEAERARLRREAGLGQRA